MKGSRSRVAEQFVLLDSWIGNIRLTPIIMQPTECSYTSGTMGYIYRGPFDIYTCRVCVVGAGKLIVQPGG